MAKKTLSVGSSRVLEIIKENGEKMTFAEIKNVFDGANPSHLGALIRNGKVEATKEMVEETITRNVEKTVYYVK